MLQVIQTYQVSDNFSIVNNTFYDYMNRYNQTEDYYADTAKAATPWRTRPTSSSISIPDR